MCVLIRIVCCVMLFALSLQSTTHQGATNCTTTTRALRAKGFRLQAIAAIFQFSTCVCFAHIWPLAVCLFLDDLPIFSLAAAALVMSLGRRGTLSSTLFCVDARQSDDKNMAPANFVFSMCAPPAKKCLNFATVFFSLVFSLFIRGGNQSHCLILCCSCCCCCWCWCVCVFHQQTKPSEPQTKKDSLIRGC